jgi:HEPN domain-containing protein
MRDEVQGWLEFAKSDMENAQILHKAERYPAAVFHCQQTIEKALKGLYIDEVGTLFPRSHSLAEIAQSTSFPREHFPFLRDLTSRYIDTRYPSFPTERITDIYDEQYSADVISKTEGILKWILNRLNKT